MNEVHPYPEDQSPNEHDMPLTEDVSESRVREELQLHALASAQISFRGLQMIFHIGALNATETWKRLRSKDQPAEPTE